MKTFPMGGVHPSENKLSKAKPIEVLALPDTVRIPLAQHIGAPAVAKVAKGDKVWTIAVQDVAAIGRLFLGGKVDLHKVIALTGSEVAEPKYYRIMSGAPVASVTEGNIKPQAEGDKVRIISGNVLTGRKVAETGFITAFANQITVIPEGDKYELLGWAAPRFGKFSVSRSSFT